MKQLWAPWRMAYIDDKAPRSRAAFFALSIGKAT